MWRLLRKSNGSPHRRRDPNSEHTHGLGTNKNFIVGTTRPETNNECADEDQQHCYTVLLYLNSTSVTEDGKNMVTAGG